MRATGADQRVEQARMVLQRIWKVAANSNLLEPAFLRMLTFVYDLILDAG